MLTDREWSQKERAGESSRKGGQIGKWLREFSSTVSEESSFTESPKYLTAVCILIYVFSVQGILRTVTDGGGTISSPRCTETHQDLHVHVGKSPPPWSGSAYRLSTLPTKSRWWSTWWGKASHFTWASSLICYANLNMIEFTIWKYHLRLRSTALK